MRRIYLDHNATTPLAPEVFEAMKPYWLEDYGNASSIHWYGQRAKAAVEAARVEVARLINADPSEVVFTSGGTESDNAALFGVAEAVKPAAAHGTRHVITTSIEHHAVLHAARELERRGVEVTYVPVGSSGVVDPEDVERAIRPHTVLISVMHANNEMGTLQPLEEIGRMARERLDEEDARLGTLRDDLEDGVSDSIPMVAVNGDPKRRLPTTTNLRFDGVDGEALVIAMDLKGVACSTGAACSSGSLEPSHVLAAIGLTREQARSSIRFSLGRSNTKADVDITLEVLPRVVERLQSVSPHNKKPAMVV